MKNYWIKQNGILLKNCNQMNFDKFYIDRLCTFDKKYKRNINLPFRMCNSLSRRLVNLKIILKINSTKYFLLWNSVTFLINFSCDLKQFEHSIFSKKEKKKAWKPQKKQPKKQHKIR